MFPGNRCISLLHERSVEDSAGAVTGGVRADQRGPEPAEQCLRSHAPRDLGLLAAPRAPQLHHGRLRGGPVLPAEGRADERTGARHRPPKHHHRIREWL